LKKNYKSIVLQSSVAKKILQAAIDDYWLGACLQGTVSFRSTFGETVVSNLM